MTFCLFFWISELNVDRNVAKYKKTPKQMNGSLRELSISWSHLLALISSRSVGTRGHSRKGIILLKYQYFRSRIKAGVQFEIFNWQEKHHWAQRLLMLHVVDLTKNENDNVVHFTILFRTVSKLKSQLCIAEIHKPKNKRQWTNRCTWPTFCYSTCMQQLLPKAGVKSENALTAV